MLERNCLWLLSSPPLPPTSAWDEGAQQSCVGLLSYYTWATPVTVKATPSAVSTSSQRGCNVIISREILPRNAKQGHGSRGPGPVVWEESNTSLLQLGWARGPVVEEGGEDSPRGCWQNVRRKVGWQGRVGTGGSRGRRMGMLPMSSAQISLA